MKLTVEDKKEIIDMKKGGATNISIVMKLVVNGSAVIELICLYNAHGDLVLEAKLCSKQHFPDFKMNLVSKNLGGRVYARHSLGTDDEDLDSVILGKDLPEIRV